MYRLNSLRRPATTEYDYAPISNTATNTTAPPRRSLITSLLAVYSVVVTLVLVGRGLFGPSSQACGSQAPGQAPLLSDFTSSLRYSTQTPAKDAWHNALYSGDPSPAVEKAWHQLLNKMKRGYAVKISVSEANELGFTDYEQLSDGRILSAPAVYHDLHCLRRLRQLLYAEHYYPDASPEQLKDNRHHTSHCLETIRASLVCNPNLSLLRVTHVPGDKEPYKAAPAPVQRCVDWESLVKIVDSRTA